MTGLLSDPGQVALAFTTSVFAVMGAVTLSGAVRFFTRRPGRVLHLLTLASGVAALVLLGVLSAGIDAGPWLIPGFAAVLAAGAFWLVGALVARARPPWLDLAVILSVLGFLTAYAAMADRPGEVPAVFPGLTAPRPATEAAP